VAYFSLLPQGQPEKDHRVKSMMATMAKELFGACTNTGACEAACPKGIAVSPIVKLNRKYFSALLRR
jgi:succinate dehydrogenase / fumarate reductase iron-sulfur subunit